MNKLVSSTYSLTVIFGMQFSISLTYNKNNKGPRTLPCGTPQFTLTVLELIQFTHSYAVIKFCYIFLLQAPSKI